MRDDARNAELTLPYLGGEEVNRNADQGFNRYVINFGTRTLEEAMRWPALLRIVEERVKPERDQHTTNAIAIRQKQLWWRFRSDNPELYGAIRGLTRCLATARLSKHLSFSFQPPDRVFSEQLYIFPLESLSSFAPLQSRIHEPWARLLSSSMRNDLRYSASDCFETFPFPKPDPRTVLPALEDIGQRLYDFRAKYMVDENVGLTITYNRLKDPACTEARILALRELHEELDQKVLEAYAEGDPEGRWLELVVPPFCPKSDEEKKRVEAFGDGVVDRLFVLNAKRAEEERVKGLGSAKGGAAAKKTAKKAAGAGGPKKPRAKKGDSGQLGMLPGESGED